MALRFYVKDTGIGISEGQNKKIFEPFYQANKLTQNNYGGVGLGLSISKGYVELLGGEIWVQSEPGKGSTFYFTIPYRPANEIKIINTTEKQSGNATTILVEWDYYQVYSSKRIKKYFCLNEWINQIT